MQTSPIMLPKTTYAQKARGKDSSDKIDSDKTLTKEEDPDVFIRLSERGEILYTAVHERLQRQVSIVSQ